MTQVAIQLPDELSQFVQKSVADGAYSNADELFINVLSIYKDHVEGRLSESDQAKLESLRGDIQAGIDQLDRGEGIEIDWNEFRAERHHEYAVKRPV